MPLVYGQALRRAVFDGSRPWTYVLLAMTLVRLYRRASGKVPETVYLEELQPGQALLITHLPE